MVTLCLGAVAAVAATESERPLPPRKGVTEAQSGTLSGCELPGSLRLDPNGPHTQGTARGLCGCKYIGYDNGMVSNVHNGADVISSSLSMTDSSQCVVASAVKNWGVCASGTALAAESSALASCQRTKVRQAKNAERCSCNWGRSKHRSST